MAFKPRMQHDHRKPESEETTVAVYPHRFSFLIFLICFPFNRHVQLFCLLVRVLIITRILITPFCGLPFGHLTLNPVK